MTRAWAEIDLAAVRSNVSELRRATGRGLIAVVKANAYGHGAVAVGRAALEAGARALAVATVDEALELAEHVPGQQILILGALLEEELLAALGSRAAVSVHTLEDLDRVGRVARSLAKRARVHIEVDTGLSRHGVPSSGALELLDRALSTPGVVLEGLMTHLARADDRAATLESLARFEPVVSAVRARAPGVVVHAAASTAAICHEEARYDLVRPGIALHGIDPKGAARALGIELSPVLALRAKVVRIRELEANTAVGYGATFTTRRASRLAIVGLGYDDGLPYRLSNCGTLLVRGVRCPIVGTVMMDYALCDVTEVPGVVPGDVATAIGRDGEASITAEDVAREVGMIPYAVTCGLGRRAPRVYSGERVRAAVPELTASAKWRRSG